MMSLKNNGSLWLFLVLLHALMLRVLAGRHGMDVSSLVGPNLDEQTVEQMWLDCGLDLVAIKEELQSTCSYLSNENLLASTEISPKVELFAKGSLREALNLLSPEVNRSFLDCLIRQKFLLYRSGEDSLKIWFADYLESLLSSTARRHLAVQSSESPDSALVPGSDLDVNVVSPPAPTTSVNQPEHRPPAHSLLGSGSDLDPDNLKNLQKLANVKPSPQNSDDTNTPPPLVVQNSNTMIIIVVAVTAAVTSIFVALVFMCFFRIQRRDSFSGYSMKDNNPLLSMSLSDFSASGGSSQRSFSTTSSLLAPPRPLKTDPSLNVQVSSVDGCLNGTPNSTLDNCLSAPKNTLASQESLTTDPSENIQVSSLDISVETPSSDVHPRNSNSSTEPDPSKISTETPAPAPPAPAPAPPPPPPPPVIPPPVWKPGPTPPTPPPRGPPPPPPRPSPRGPPPPGPPPPPTAGPRPPPKAGPPPPPKSAAPPRPAQGKLNIGRPSKAPPLAPKHPGEAVADDTNSTKTKLKPFFWDKVQARNNQSMVWDRLKAGSFQFDEEMIENLFGYTDKTPAGKKVLSGKDATAQFVRILEAKKSQNLAISLKAMNVKSEDVCEALVEGNELPAELLHILIKMAPTTEEELKLRLYSEPSQLGPAEQFIRTVVEIPFAYERMEALLFMTSLQEESSSTSMSFSTIEVACKELRSSRLFSKLLEAVLKTGNRMNDGTYRGGAHAFKLDTLLKLADVRGTDGKTTLLHFVVLEIIRAEGVRAARNARESRSSISSLNSDDLFDDPPTENEEYFRNLGLTVVSGLSSELENVKKAAGFDADGLTQTVSMLGERLFKTREFLKSKMENCDQESRFHQSLRGFVEHADADIKSLTEREKKMRLLVKETTDYFHGNGGKDEGLRLFVIVRDFLNMIDKVCKEVKVLPKPPSKTQRSKETPAMSPARDPPPMSPARDPRQLLFPAIKDRRIDSSDSSSSDDDD